jgi:UDP-N-acetylglucosamine transferase subunit ALG13
MVRSGGEKQRNNVYRIGYMIFLTVGSQIPFDRLVQAVDIPENRETVFGQIGASEYTPQYIQYVKFMEKDEFDRQMESCSAVISHAGMGTIIQAVSIGKSLLAVPRLKKYNEVVNDHQVASAKRFESLGYLMAAYDTDEIQKKLPALMTFSCRQAGHDRQLIIDHIKGYLDSLT